MTNLKDELPIIVNRQVGGTGVETGTGEQDAAVAVLTALEESVCDQ